MTCGKVLCAATNGTGNLTHHYKKDHPTLTDKLKVHIQRCQTEDDSPKKTQTTLNFGPDPRTVNLFSV